MSNTHGKFVWYDVMTTDTKAAESFYRNVIGWEAKDSGMPDSSYTLFSVGSTMVGGLMPIPEAARKAGVGPAWMGYIGVDDVDACARHVKSAGGAIRREPEDIPGIGRFAVCSDPHGAGFMLFKGTSDQAPAPASAGTPGHVGWRVYQIFAIDGAPAGGMMTKMPELPAPFWLYYFNVEAVDAAAARVKNGGGKIANGPLEVPGGSWIVQCFDPQGAMFALVGSKR
jgi:uncharacterized protein